MLGIFHEIALCPIKVTSYPRTVQKAGSTVMAMWQKYQCRLCGDIIQDHRQRRVLHNEGNDHARLVLLELLSARFPNKSTGELQQHLSPADPSNPGLNQSYICKHLCFSCLEKKQGED